MHTRTTLAIAAIFLIISGSSSAQYTANLTLTCKEIRVGRGLVPNSTLCVMFNTCNIAAETNRQQARRRKTLREQNPNGEFRPNDAIPGSYVADYVILDSANSRVLERGMITVALSAEDLDGNGLPDLVEPSFSTDIVFKGEATPTFTDGEMRVTKPLVTGRLRRDSGSAVGSYELEMFDSETAAAMGSFEIQQWMGALTYRRYSTPLRNWAFISLGQNAFGEAIPMVGKATFKATPDELVLNRLIVRPHGFRTLLPTELARIGNRFVGELRMVDGYRASKSEDYSVWILTVTDEIDSDGDGIPEIADVIAPTIIVQPDAAAAGIGGTAMFRVKAVGDPPVTYQWQFNGEDIVGATNATLRLTHVQQSQAGNYTAIVSGPGGSVISSSPRLMINPWAHVD